MRKLNKKLSLKDIRILIATWFGSGLLQPASGTWGTIFALPFGVAMVLYGDIHLLISACMLVFYLGYLGAKEFEALKEHDCQAIVADEVVGMWIAMIPMFFLTSTFPFYFVVLTAFALFRFFDVLKPWPISYFDKKQGAFYVMFDDVLGGIAAAIVLWAISLV